MDIQNSQTKKRASWTSSFGFIMAAAGSAIGLGNLWGFPYKMGVNGGAIYLLIYIILVLAVGTVVWIAELAIGRKTRLNATGAFRTLGKKHAIWGYIGLLTGFVILSFYSVLASWGFKYFFTYIGEIFGGSGISSAGTFYATFIAGTWGPILYHGAFMAITAAIVMCGVSNGIQRVSSVIMPGLFIILVLLAMRSLTLPGAVDGLAFMFKPDFSVLRGGGFGRVLSAALGQMFFSLSMGMGVMITYGSYIPDKTNIEKSAFIVPFMDTAAAVLAGLVIMPAVFAYGLDPAAGPTLLFSVMSEVFASMPMGAVFGALFYLLVIFAAISSSISILEGITAFFVDEKNANRRKSTAISAAVAFVCGIPVALSFGLLKNITLPILNGEWWPILDWYDYLSEYVLMTLGALFVCILVGWIIKPKTIIEEVEKYDVVFRTKKLWSFMIKYITPVLIFLTFLTSAGLIKF